SSLYPYTTLFRSTIIIGDAHAQTHPCPGGERVRCHAVQRKQRCPSLFRRRENWSSDGYGRRDCRYHWKRLRRGRPNGGGRIWRQGSWSSRRSDRRRPPASTRPGRVHGASMVWRGECWRDCGRSRFVHRTRGSASCQGRWSARVDIRRGHYTTHQRTRLAVWVSLDIRYVWPRPWDRLGRRQEWKETVVHTRVGLCFRTFAAERHH